MGCGPYDFLKETQQSVNIMRRIRGAYIHLPGNIDTLREDTISLGNNTAAILLKVCVNNDSRGLSDLKDIQEHFESRYTQYDPAAYRGNSQDQASLRIIEALNIDLVSYRKGGIDLLLRNITSDTKTPGLTPEFFTMNTCIAYAPLSTDFIYAAIHRNAIRLFSGREGFSLEPFFLDTTQQGQVYFKPGIVTAGSPIFGIIDSDSFKYNTRSIMEAHLASHYGESFLPVKRN